MRISELAERGGVPLPTVKYYLREGMLPPGESVSATRADYGEEHVRRLALIRALTDAAGLPLQRVKTILGLIDSPTRSLFEALGGAVAALPPYPDDSRQTPTDGAEYPRARAALEALGQVYDPRFAAVAQLERALAGVEAAGIPMTADRLQTYGRHIRAMAEYDLAKMPADGRAEQLGYAVLGTALYEPVIAALRRLAHQDIAARLLEPDA
ncbi:MerR family transcriptional regulator [Leifsonia sp. NPDC080035]|uniref:MerR family transcriptional regulator n=1 Tax=Leifsonia sp. NPDC080035 TaxID=3143936 RepID=A0AAU7G9V5_9MICO